MVTSLYPNWPPHVLAMAVPVLSPAEAIAFLLTRTGQPNEATATTLAEELGHLPLALSQAAAYINARVLTLEGYLERFRTQRREVLKRGELPTTKPPLPQRGSWHSKERPNRHRRQKVCWRSLPSSPRTRSRSSCSWQVLRPCRATPSDHEGPVALDDAVVALRRYSFVEVINDQTVSVHRLVQAVVQDHLTRDQQRAWVRPRLTSWQPHCRMKETIRKPGQLGTRSCPTLLPRCNMDRTRPHRLGGRELNGRVGVHLAARGRPEEARPMLEHALMLSESDSAANMLTKR